MTTEIDELSFFPLYSEDTLQQRIYELGAQIASDYAGQDLILVGVLKGSFLFIADLARSIYHAQQQQGFSSATILCDFLGLQSYGDQTHSSGIVQITADLTRPVEGKHVLVVEDIVDTGLTMAYLLENLATRKPASVRICTLLHKPSRTIRSVPIHYLGFSIEDLFVVGYGLDYKQRYRHLPFIAYLPPGL